MDTKQTKKVKKVKEKTTISAGLEPFLSLLSFDLSSLSISLYTDCVAIRVYSKKKKKYSSNSEISENRKTIEFRVLSWKSLGFGEICENGEGE